MATTTQAGAAFKVATGLRTPAPGGSSIHKPTGFPKRTAALLVLVVVALWLAGWAYQTTHIPVFILRSLPSGEAVSLNEWRLLGPFDWTGVSLGAISAPDAPLVGRQLDHPFVPALQMEGGTSEVLSLFADRHLLTRYSGQAGLVRLGDEGSNASFRVYYAETRVSVSQDQDLALKTENDDAIKVWLNGQVVQRSSRVGLFSASYTPVHLVQGVNTLLVKLVRARVTDLREPWDFVIGLASLTTARQDIITRSDPAFIPNVIVNGQSPLTIDLRLFAPNKTASVQITQAGLSTTSYLPTGKKNFLSLPRLNEGAFSMHVTAGPEGIEQRLLYGSIDHLLPSYEKSLLAASGLVAGNSAGAVLFRLHHLLLGTHRKDADPVWQRKVVQLATIAEAANAAEEKAAKVTPQSRTYYRSFRSNVDGGLQHYLLHVPSDTRRGTPVPLVVIVPFAEAPLRPFLESRTVADFENLERLDHAADQNGFAYLIYNNRGNTSGQPIGFASMFEAIAAARSAYDLDPERTYLLGVCAGGRDALKLASLYPHEFAAISLLSPALQYMAPAEMDPARPTDLYAAGELRRDEPLQILKNLRAVPILSVHGAEDRHVPVQNSLALQSQAQKLGVPFTLHVIPGAMQFHYPVDVYVDLFAFFKGKIRASESQRVDASAQENHRSIDSAFTAPFLVVAGTRDGEHSSAQRSAAKFVQSWRSRFFAECRLKTDTQLSEVDITSNNLIVFGTPDSNSLLARINARLPLSSAAELARQAKFSAAPGQLSMQAVFPNPLNTSKSVVLAGSSTLSGCPEDAIQLALKGWYGAALWSQTEKSPCHLVTVGFMDGSSHYFQPVQAPSRFGLLSRGQGEVR